jgi:phage replication-related protein YjqB (UPF0714/DUF867 family)
MRSSGTVSVLAIALLSLTMRPIFTWAESIDHYQNFKDLSQHEKLNFDYRVEFENRHSQICVLAIHGGKIEEGSDDVAREIAGKDLSFYIFQAIKSKKNKMLHITSTHFDDPKAFAITDSAKLAISIHGFKETEKDIACMGGGNDLFREKIAKAISSAKFSVQISVESPCDRFGGNGKGNITNRPKDGGVQIELSTHLREVFLKNREFLSQFSHVIRDAALQFKPL